MSKSKTIDDELLYNTIYIEQNVKIKYFVIKNLQINN